MSNAAAPSSTRPERVWRPGQVKLLAYWLCIALACFVVVRPTFNYYSYAAARLSDLAAIAALCLLTLIGAAFAGQFPVRALGVRFGWALALACAVLISLVGQGMIATFAPEDFADIARPALMFFALSAGYFMTYSFCALQEVNKGLVVLGAFGLVLGFAEALAPGPAGIIWKVYSVKTTMVGFGTGRPTAFFYHFTEFANFMVLCGLILFVDGAKARFWRRICFILGGIIFIVSSTISTSRVGLIFVAIAGAYYLIDDLVRKFSLNRLMLYLLVAGSAVGAGVAVVMLDPRFQSLYTLMVKLAGHIEIKALANIGNKSIANRAQQVLVYLDVFAHHDYRIWIGSGPMRQVNQNYFEIEWVKFLFRYGVLGFAVYYSIYVGAFFTHVTREITNSMKVIRALCIAYILCDMMSTVSEIVKGIAIFMFWYGAVLGERDKRISRIPSAREADASV